MFVNELVHRAPVRALGVLFPCAALFFLGAMVFLGPSRSANAEPISCDFSSVPGASIRFTGTGDKIEFPDGLGGYDFVITSPSLYGLQGNIGGTFIVGTITTVGGMEQADLTTNGTFSLYDGVSNTLTANLDWKDITVYNKLSGVMNGDGAVNLTNIQYAGSNPGLKQIRDGTDQSVVLTFQFSPLAKKSLTELMTDGQVSSTSYSGSLSSVPEPSSCVMLGGMAVGLLLLLVARLRRKTV